VSKKSKRSGTRGGNRIRLPTDVVDAAEAALDDMLRPNDSEDDEPMTQTRPPSAAEIEEGDVEEEEAVPTTRRNDLPIPAARRSKMPLPAPPHTTSVETLDQVPRASPPPRVTPQLPRTAPPTPPGRVSPLPAPSVPRAVSPHVAPRADSSPSAPTRPTPPAPTRPTPNAPRPDAVVRTAATTPVLPRPPVRRDLSEVLDSLRPPTNAEPPPSWTGPTQRDSPRALSELLETAPRANRYEPPVDETARVPTELPIDLDEAGDPDDVAPARPELASLNVAVYEESAHLGSVQSAIAAAGHVVQIAATGRDGVGRIVVAIEDPDSDIDAVVVALPGGDAIIEAALALEPKRPIVIASLGRNPLDAVQRAHAAGADLVTIRPHDVDRLAPTLFAASRLFIEKRALAARGGDGDDVRGLVAYDVFQRMVELEIARAKKFDYPLSIALFAVEVGTAPPAGLRGIVRARAGNALIHSVRDIDIATQLEQERFLVLMPHTDVKGAAAVARRVIAAVAACDPVVSAGKAHPPRLVGAVAGALAGQPLSFDKLMKDATRVLEQARRDGAELAVQP
jgi:hypothetical protein